MSDLARIIERAKVVQRYGISLNIMPEEIPVVLEALEKQIRKKPIREAWSISRCPTCLGALGEYLGDGYTKDWESLEICDCGQKIDWGD
ncbi:MAG: hypothetical protein ACK5JH_15295 [Anaerocolumna sp.]